MHASRDFKAQRFIRHLWDIWDIYGIFIGYLWDIYRIFIETSKGRRKTETNKRGF
jgi:hypothetical protein